MNDIKLAMLGSKEAAKRLTDAGVLLPCPHCGNDDDCRIVIRSRKTRKSVSASITMSVQSTASAARKQLGKRDWERTSLQKTPHCCGTPAHRF